MPINPTRISHRQLSRNGMQPLRPDSACCRQLNWRADVPAGIDPDRLALLMEEQGWTNRCRHPALRVLRHDQGHEVAWVLATGRMQLRIHVTVDESVRHARALELFQGFQDCLAGLTDPVETGAR